MSRNKTNLSYQANNNQRTLKCVLLLMVMKFGTSLKLTPVQHPTRKLELDFESKSVSLAFNEAKEFIINETNTFTETGVSVTLHTRAIKKLHSAIERWNMIEERLRTTISTSDQGQVSVFDETLNVIAASKVMLGQLFWRARDDDIALKQLEQSCPTLWEYDTARKSLDSDGWLDCYSTLGDIYVRMGRLEQAVELEKELLSRMPWLALTLSGNSKLRTLATISHLTRITREERRLISVYIKEAWKSAESMRAKLNELVGEFVTADTDKRRLQIYLRAKRIADEALKGFVENSNDSILYHGDAEWHDKSNNTNNLSVSNSETEMKERESNLLNSALHVELNREASFYLNTMDGIIEGGKHFLPAVRIREQEKTRDRVQSKVPQLISRESSFGLGSTISSSSITAAPMGFQSRDQVMQVFEYLLAHEAGRHEHTDATKLSAASSRAAKRAATASQQTDANRRNGRKTSSTRKHQKRDPRSEGNTETPAEPTRSYGFVGMLMALFAGSGFILRNVNLNSKQQNSCRSNVKDRSLRSAMYKIPRSTLDSAVPEETINENHNFVWLFIVSIIGVTSSSQLPTGTSKICRRLSSYILKLLLMAVGVVHYVKTTIVSLKSWTENQVKIITRRIHRRRESDLSGRGNAISPLGAAKKTVNLKSSKVEDKTVSQSTTKQKTTAIPSKKSSKASNSHPADTTHKAASNASSSGKTAFHSSTETDLQNASQSVEVQSHCQIDHSSSSNISKNDEIVNETNPYLILSIVSDIQDHESSGEELTPVNSQLLKKIDAPPSPSSVANSIGESLEDFLSDDKVFDDSYWRSIDEEEEDEGVWIETSAQQSRTRTRKALANEKQPRYAPSSLRQKQYPSQQQQHGRKAPEGCFSSSKTNNSSTSRKQPASRKISFCSNSPTTPILTPTTLGTPPALPARRQEAVSHIAAALTKKISPRTRQASNIPTQIATPSEFPPLPTTNNGRCQSQSSSVENSTDMEDHSSISGDSHMSSPRSRSLSTCQDLTYAPENHQNGLVIPMHMYPGGMMPMPFYPMGFMPMPMPIPDMSQMSFDPSVTQSIGLPPFGTVAPLPLSPQQNMMMMPFPNMYMMPHPQFDPTNQSQSMGNHLIGMTEEEAMYNIQSENHMYYEALMHSQSQQSNQVNHSQNHPNLHTSDMAQNALTESEIIMAVRQQIEYYFSPSNLCHDNYLRSRMNSEGFVCLAEISNWNRIKRIGASPLMILESVQSSNELDVVVHWDVAEAKGDKEILSQLGPQVILATLIRCINSNI